MKELFAGRNSPMVRACVQGEMGRLTAWGEESAMASVGDFCFLAGVPCQELVEQADAPILVPDGAGWCRTIQETLGERAIPFTRYATRCPAEGFNRDRLIGFTKALPQGFYVSSIGRESYFILMKEEWARDLCGNFADAGDFLKRGLGFAIARGDLLVAGASSYAVCNGAIEIEIDTRPDFRRLGLAAACGARLILECLDRGISPGWDAHDRRSLSLAEKLGYQLDHPYTAYWVEDQVRYKGDLGINEA